MEEGQEGEREKELEGVSRKQRGQRRQMRLLRDFSNIKGNPCGWLLTRLMEWGGGGGRPQSCPNFTCSRKRL